MHRHQNVTSFTDGLMARGGELVDWSKMAANRLRALFKKHVEGEGEE